MKGLYHLFLRKVAHFQVEYPILTIFLLSALTLIIFGGVSQVKTVASLEQMMPKDVEEIKAFNTLRDNNLGQDIIAIVLEVDRDSTDPEGVFDVREKRVYDYVKYIKRIIMEEPDILETYAYSDVVSMLPEEVTDKNYDEIINSYEIKKYLKNYINSDYTTTIIIATTDVSADDPRMNLLSSKIKSLVESAGHPPGLKVKFTGTPVIQQKLGELISNDRQNTQWISTLFVFLITMFIFGTFTSALVPIIVVTISVNWLYGTMGYTNLPISTLAGGVAAMVIGIGIDFAIHVMNKFKYERKKGLSVKESVEAAVVDTGTALTATSATTIAAFLAFLSGAMPEMGRFGILMAIGITYSLIFTLFGLPALLIIEERIIYWLKEKLKFGIEGELTLANKEDKCESGYEILKAKELRKGQRFKVKKEIAEKIRFDRRKVQK